MSSSSLESTGHEQLQRRPRLPETPIVLPPFTVDEIVLVFFQQRLCEAKILKADLFEQKWWRFYVSYMVKDPPKGEDTSPQKATSRKTTKRANVRNQRVRKVSYKETTEEGWSEWTGWKEWVCATRIVARTCINVTKMKELQSALGISWTVDMPEKEDGLTDPIKEVWGKLERDLGVRVPSSLLMLWIEDKDLSLHIGQIVHIPAITVHSIIHDFEDTNNEEGVDTGEYLLRQFDMLFKRGMDDEGNWHMMCSLLYKTEQYGYLDKLQNVDASKKLGAEHLLRIMVTLCDYPKIMRRIPKSDTYLQHLFYYLEENQHWFISTRGMKEPRTNKVARLLYTNDGGGLLTLGSNGIQKLWKWVRNEKNPSGKANANLLMTNDIAQFNLDKAFPCLALSKNDGYVMSATGGKVSLFNMVTFEVMTTFMPPPPASTYLAFHPQDSNIIAVGMENSTILIYNVQAAKVIRRLKGHKKHLTGLAFSTSLNVLVSSGADARLCVWSLDSWKQKKTIRVQHPRGKSVNNGDTRVEFHHDAVRLLVSNASQLAIYDASKMDRMRQWVPQDRLSAPISSAALSCNSLFVFASFIDGNIGIFDADTLRLRYRVAPSGYLLQSLSNGNQALVVAAHPQDPNQFAVGLSDGSVIVQEYVSHCRIVNMPETENSKVAGLHYAHSGCALLALATNGIQKVWKWEQNEQNPSGKANANQVPHRYQPRSGLLMTNEIAEVNPDEVFPCLALSMNDSYVMSAAGGKVSLFNMVTFKVIMTFMPPPPASTYLAFHPQNNNIIAVGMENSTILIYNVREQDVKSELDGHEKRLTGLAFSTNLNILVSSGADAQLCVWSIDSWEKKNTIRIELPGGKSLNSGDTQVQFHCDALRLLVSHESQLAIYCAPDMSRIFQWVPQDSLSAPISSAAYCCKGLLVFASFTDGNIGIFDAETLRLRFRIAPLAYIPQSVSNGNQAVYPLVVATHPKDPNQFAVGLSDGSVIVIEPPEAEGNWGVNPPD